MRAHHRPAARVMLLPMWVFLAAIGAISPVQTQGPVAPERAWQMSVDRYLAGDRQGARTVLLQTPAPVLLESSRRAFEQWRAVPSGNADARRQAARHFQVSALLPVDVLIAVTGRGISTDRQAALEDAAREAWQRLGAFDDDGPEATQVRQFRTWWRLTLVQNLIESGRFAEVSREATAVHPPQRDAEAVAALALLRGVAIETRARLADTAPTGSTAVSMRRVPVAARTGPMVIAMEEAGKQYRRALELQPGDREATLRLGRIEIERDRLTAAERTLAPLLTVPCGDAICGLAHLFTGELLEARKDLEHAASAYARASAIPGVRHSALVAMMQVSMRRGNAGGAYDLTRQFATPVAIAPRQAPDAWSLYASGRLVESDRILTRLIAMVLP